jgi:hypothetical protein
VQIITELASETQVYILYQDGGNLKNSGSREAVNFGKPKEPLFGCEF